MSEVTPKQTAQLYYDLGNAYTQLGEQDKATAAYLNALKLDSSLLKASYNLSRVYIESGQFAKAIKLLEALLSEDPQNLTVLDTLGYAYYKEGKRNEALTYYDKVLKLSPSNKNALYNRGMILSELGKTSEAVDAFSTLYKLDNSTNLLLTLGKLEIAAKKLPEAIHYLEAFHAQKPDDLEGLTALADAYRSEKLYDKALKTYDAALKVKPKAAKLLFAKAEILLTEIQDATNGVKALKAALDAGFKDRKALDSLVANPNLVDKQAVEGLVSSLSSGTQSSSGGAPNG